MPAPERSGPCSRRPVPMDLGRERWRDRGAAVRRREPGDPATGRRPTGPSRTNARDQAQVTRPRPRLTVSLTVRPLTRNSRARYLMSRYVRPVTSGHCVPQGLAGDAGRVRAGRWRNRAAPGRRRRRVAARRGRPAGLVVSACSALPGQRRGGSRDRADRAGAGRARPGRRPAHTSWSRPPASLHRLPPTVGSRPRSAVAGRLPARAR